MKKLDGSFKVGMLFSGIASAVVYFLYKNLITNALKVRPEK
jgi:CHASE3 domain sensor protein